jgi:hypothetical protein
MKKLLICGMLLGLLTTLSVAQRGRAVGGVGPTAGVSNNAPMAHTMPNAVTTNHDSVAPNATNSRSHSKTVAPNATTSPNTKSTTPPDARNVPNRVMLPDADGLGTQPRVNPNQ